MDQPVNRARAFQVVEDFEHALSDHLGAPYCVTTDSCTNALWLALRWAKKQTHTLYDNFAFEQTPNLHVPKHTYVGVVQAARNAGWGIQWADLKWEGSYPLPPTNVIDSAKKFEKNMYQPGTLTCVSFQAGKLLPVGRGGAILHDNPQVDEWLRRARLDGRAPGQDYSDPTFQRFAAHCYLDPPSAARGLWLLTYINDNDQCNWTEYPDLSQATWT